MRILYIGNVLNEKPQTGGEQVHLRNFKLLEDVVGEANIETFERVPKLISKVKTISEKFTILKEIFTGQMDGIGNAEENEICTLVAARAYDYVFITTSKLGRLCTLLKKKFPQVRIITFMQNVEYHYFSELVKTDGFKKKPLAWAAKYNERCMVKASDIIIALNERDSNLLKKLYGRAADAKLPISFQDEFDLVKQTQAKKQSNELQYLFVGSNFFANYHGIKWFLEMVMPFVEGKLTIVGKGTEEWRGELARENVQIVGAVQHLEQYYYESDFVVSPIFMGAGMKTKTAEALMYGKTILGTTEAFEGYELTAGAMELCNTAEEFITCINKYAQIIPIPQCNQKARELFLEKHSFASSINTVRNVLKL